MSRRSSKFNLKDFENIKNNNNIQELNITSINLINAISKKVGAPSYRKTPVFRKKKVDNQIFNSNFTKTEFIVKIDENEINHDKIRELLNKLTNNNYNEISDEIINNLKHFIYTQNDIILMDFGVSIFEISSVNKFWVKLYAKLFYKLISNFPKMRTICVNQYTTLLEIFNVIEFGDENDYDHFCTINKQNDKRRALVSFYTELYKYDILGNDEFKILLEKLFNLMKTTNKKDIFDEIFENINIILKEIGEELMNDNISDFIQQNISDIINILDETNISKKIKFKLLDIIEMLDMEIDD